MTGKARLALFSFGLSQVAMVAFALYVTFANPDMTETRLLLTYWKETVALVLWLVLSIFWFKVVS